MCVARTYTPQIHWLALIPVATKMQIIISKCKKNVGISG